MKVPFAAGALAALAAIGLSATAVRCAEGPIVPPLAPALVLSNYGSALERVAHPPNLEFEISLEQIGPRNIEQTHRIYRHGLSERDEIVSVDGQALTTPAVRILRDRTYRYDIAAVAPRLHDYVFTFVDVERKGSRLTYRFKAEPRVPGDFAVSDIFVDASYFLPSVVRFRMSANGVRGSGELVYGRTERYWLIRQAAVSVHLPNGAIGHERILWSRYQFPLSLPPSTFAAPHALATDTPATPP